MDPFTAAALGFFGSGLLGSIFGGRKPKPPPAPPPTPAPPAPDRTAEKTDRLVMQRDQQSQAHRSMLRRGRHGGGMASPFAGLGG